MLWGGICFLESPISMLMSEICELEQKWFTLAAVEASFFSLPGDNGDLLFVKLNGKVGARQA